MKRFHVHIAVDDLGANVEFYSRLFGLDPEKRTNDYAKWVLSDPAVNFAVSSRGGASGIDHLGFQADDQDELKRLQAHAEEASGNALLETADAHCCYAHSRKHWVLDPQGVPWEHFETLAEAPTFGEETEHDRHAGCCLTEEVAASTAQRRGDLDARQISAPLESCC